MDYLLHHFIRRSAARFPTKEALVCLGRRLTYEQVAYETESLASGLLEVGAGRGDRVGVFLEPSVPQVLSISASVAQGPPSFRSTIFFFLSRWRTLRETAE